MPFTNEVELLLMQQKAKKGAPGQRMIFFWLEFVWPWIFLFGGKKSRWSGGGKCIGKQGGGNSNIFGIFTPILGEDEPILT